MAKPRLSEVCVECGGPHFANARCRKHYNAQHRCDNPEKYKAWSKRWYAARRADVIAKSAAWAKANPEKSAQCHREWQKANPERVRENQARYQARNRDYELQKKREYSRANRAQLRALAQRRYEANRPEYYRRAQQWKKQHPDKVLANGAARRARKCSGTPSWGNAFFISEIYDLCRLRSKLTGINWHVDHVVPLRHPLVCGLHWEGNLQVVTAAHNYAKNNRHWPDMP